MEFFFKWMRKSKNGLGKVKMGEEKKIGLGKVELSLTHMGQNGLGKVDSKSNKNDDVRELQMFFLKI